MRITLTAAQGTFIIDGIHDCDLAENQYKSLLKEIIDKFPHDYLFQHGNKIIEKYAQLYGNKPICIDSHFISYEILDGWKLPAPADNPAIEAFKKCCIWNNKGKCDRASGGCFGEECSKDKCELLKDFINELNK